MNDQITQSSIIALTNIGKIGITNHKFCWARTMSFKFNEPTHKRTFIIIIPIDTS